MSDWAALNKWPKLMWWCQEHGHRSVPIELGCSGQPGWQEEIMTIDHFIRNHMARSCSGPTPEPQSRPFSDKPADGPRVDSGAGIGCGTAAACPGNEEQCFVDLDKGGNGHGDAPSCHSSSAAYLAQHPLLDQLPSLLEDLSTPKYCRPGGPKLTNAWLGTGMAWQIRFFAY